MIKRRRRGRMGSRWISCGVLVMTLACIQSDVTACQRRRWASTWRSRGDLGGTWRIIRDWADGCVVDDCLCCNRTEPCWAICDTCNARGNSINISLVNGWGCEFTRGSWRILCYGADSSVIDDCLCCDGSEPRWAICNTCRTGSDGINICLVNGRGCEFTCRSWRVLNYRTDSCVIDDCLCCYWAKSCWAISYTCSAGSDGVNISLVNGWCCEWPGSWSCCNRQDGLA